MKNIFNTISFFILLVFAYSCSKPEGIHDDLSFIDTAASSNQNSIFDISTDNSRLYVKLRPLEKELALLKCLMDMEPVDR